MAMKKVLCICLCVWLLLSLRIAASPSCVVSLTNNGPDVVVGAKITFTATLSEDCSRDNLTFVFADNTGITRSKEFANTVGKVNWTVDYEWGLYKPRQYTAEVVVKRFYSQFLVIRNLHLELSKASNNFTLTDTLNGALVSKQDKIITPVSFALANRTVHHYIQLPEAEINFIRAEGLQVVTSWYVDCLFVGMTYYNMSVNLAYQDSSDYCIDAVVYVNYGYTRITAMNETVTPIRKSSTRYCICPNIPGDSVYVFTYGWDATHRIYGQYKATLKVLQEKPQDAGNINLLSKQNTSPKTK